MAVTTAVGLVESIRPERAHRRLARFTHLPTLAGFVPALVLTALLALLSWPQHAEALERVGAMLTVFLTWHVIRTRPGAAAAVPTPG